MVILYPFVQILHKKDKKDPMFLIFDISLWYFIYPKALLQRQRFSTKNLIKEIFLTQYFHNQSIF